MTTGNYFLNNFLLNIYKTKANILYLVSIAVYFLYVCFVDRCLSVCTFFFWPLCYLFFFNIRVLIAPFVSSNSSYTSVRLTYTILCNEMYISTCIQILHSSDHIKGFCRHELHKKVWRYQMVNQRQYIE